MQAPPEKANARWAPGVGRDKRCKCDWRRVFSKSLPTFKRRYLLPVHAAFSGRSLPSPAPVKRSSSASSQAVRLHSMPLMSWRPLAAEGGCHECP